jgi:DNA invertase Pin-like site-specific DNA recombinase
MTGKFVSYLRVSTQRQGHSGLGLEAQRSAVEGYLNGGKWKLIQEVVEVESGKRSDRPELAKALALCRIHRATLLVAKIDRLARNVHFISTLMESGVKFTAVDMPDVNDMIVHILAAVAQGEAKAISQRTRDAFAAAKKRGAKLGGKRELKIPEGMPETTPRVPWDLGSVSHMGRMAGTLVRRQKRDRFIDDILPIIQDKQRQGATSLRQIAEALNADGAPAPSGGQWYAIQVQRVLKAAQQAA